MKTIEKLDLKGKRVFLRADLNIPISDKKILQDYKLEKIIPTIDYIIKNGGKVILATHIGRPKTAEHTNFFDIDLTTKILIPWFKNKGYKIRYEVDLEKAITVSKQNFSEETFNVGEILLLENLRFFNGEKGSPQEREKFATILRKTADIYINDAFALSHRDDTSVTLLPQKFEIKSIGLLTEEEISQLNKIKKDPEQPFVLILGGNKIKTKIPLLKNLIEKENDRPSSIIIGGAIADVFLDAKDLSKTKYNSDKEEIEFAKSFLEKAKENNIKILLPIDKLNLDIGPETIKMFCEEIKKAKTIFVNGTMGVYQKEDSQTGTKEILKSIANSNAYTVAGGGDCVAAIYMFELQNKFNFLSTGGGATLAFLGS